MKLEPKFKFVKLIKLKNSVGIYVTRLALIFNSDKAVKPLLSKGMLAILLSFNPELLD